MFVLFICVHLWFLSLTYSVKLCGKRLFESFNRSKGMNIGKMMQQAKKMQENMKQMQEEMAAMEVTGEAGGGMVKVLMTGDQMVRRVDIDPSVWAEQDKDLIEDLMAAAVNQAAKKVSDMQKQKQQGLMAGMPLPPGFSL